MQNHYQFVRYPGKPFPQTHPDRLATFGVLYGIEPTSIYRARVLEIGCCDGGNLIPMALSLPGSEFIGIDLTEPDITDAREAAAALGLANIQFHVMDLTELPGSLGQFDYVICHGLYSWIPLPVREKLLDVIAASLTPNGIAYVSYNALPGGHVRMMVRDMLLLHLRGVTDRDEKLVRAREFLQYLKSAMKRTVQESIVVKQVELTLAQADHGLFHDELAEHYNPVYFHEFVAHAARYGMQYLSEANYFATRPEVLGSDYAGHFVQATQGFGIDPIPPVQFLDFLHCSYFHQTLLCRSQIPLKRPVHPEQMKHFSFASPATAEPATEGGEAFIGPQGSRIATSSPFARKLIHAIIDIYPRSVNYKDLPGAQTDEAELCGILLALMNMGIAAAHLHSPEFSLIAGDRPVAGPLARRQAANSQPLTDLRHCRADKGNALEMALLPLLDGTRTRAALLAELPSGLFPADETPESRLIQLNEALDVLANRCLLLS
jgi:SAM-dependent methyltransferase